MASTSPDSDLEAQINIASEPQSPVITGENPPPTTDTATPQPMPQPPIASSVGPQPQAANAAQHHNGNSPAQGSAGNSQAQRDEKHGDSSDGLWSIYLTEAEKRDTEVIESWKGDTNGILVFTGLFSATVASFIIESYQSLSPNSSDVTNALLTQISQQLVNISHGTPLTSIVEQSSQPFTPTASAVRVNVMWFLSLILSLNCALSATLMQQWARRYQELGQRRGTFHRRGRMRAYIFDGIRRFRMARAVAAMPTLLHISVFLFFAGLVEFLFPVQATVAYVALGCIGAFTLAYAILTVLPNIYLSCPYATPLSGSTWRISQVSVIGYLWTVLKFEECRYFLITLWRLTNQSTPGPDQLRRWRETLEKKVNIRRRWLSQGMQNSIKLSAYNADSVMVTSALEWTLTALDEDKEIEDFAAQVPGFFDSRVVSDATLAVLPLMSHQPNTDPIFGSRLCDLLKTCIPETSILDEEKRKNRLRVCLKCLWYFGKAYNELGSSRALPPYFPDALANPEITHRIQTEKDVGVRVIGRCFGALIANKLAADLESRVDPISDVELACLSAILGTTGGHHDVKLLLKQPGAVTLLNMISLTFDKIDGLVIVKAPPGVQDVVQQTLDILSQTGSSEKHAEVDRLTAIINGSDGNFERILVSRIFDLLNACIQGTSHHTEGVRTSCLRLCLRGLWYFGRESNQLKSFAPLPSYLCIALANPDIANGIGRSNDLEAHEIWRCVGALIVNKLAVDINSRTDPIDDVELRCISTILSTKTSDVARLLRHPGAIQLTNIVFLALADIDSASACVPPDVPDATRQTFDVLCQALPDGLNAAMRRDQGDTVINGTSSFTAETYLSVLRVWMKNLWLFTRQYNEQSYKAPLPPYVCVAFTNPEMTRRIHKQHDLAIRVIGRCVEALVIIKLAADINSRGLPVNNEELACLSAILGTKSDDVMLLLSCPGAIEFTEIVFLALDDSYTLNLGSAPSYVLDVVQQTSGALRVYQGLHTERKAKIRLNQTNTLMNICAGASSLTAKTYLCILRAWMKNLWHFTRGYSERDNSAALPYFVCIAFTNPEMTRRIRKHRDLAIRVIGRCVEALVVNKLAADIHSRHSPVTDDELACLSAILGTKSRDVMLLLSCPGAIEFTNMVFLALDDSVTFARGTVPSYVLDVIQPTSSALSRVLPPQLITKMRIDQTNTLMHSDGSSCLTAERYMSLLNEWMKNLWNFTRECDEQEDRVPLPSYVCIAFTNPEMCRRIRKQRDLAIHVTGRCVEVLIVNKLAGDINSRNVPAREHELACLSTILGTKSDDLTHLLSRPGAIETTNLVFLALGDFDTFAPGAVPSYTPDVVRQTFYALYIALPSGMRAKMRLNQELTLMNISDESSSFTTEMYWTLLRVWMQNLWRFIKEYIEDKNSEALPSYFCAAFTNPAMTLRVRKHCDLTVRVVGRCVEALVVKKLAAHIHSRSRNLSVSNDELMCLSAILGTKSHDVMLLLGCPGAIELTNMVFHALDNLYSFTLQAVPSYVLSVVQHTSSALSRALPSELDDEMRLSQRSTLMNLSDGTSSRTAEMYRIMLRFRMKNLWYCTKGYTERRHTLPPYVCVAFTNPEMSRRIHEERDLAVRVMGLCVEALVVNKLAADINSRNAPASNDELVCLSAILGTKSDDVTRLLRHPGAIEFTNIVFLALGDFYSAPPSFSLDVADVVQNTFDILSSALPARMRLDLTDALTTLSNAQIYGTMLYLWMNNLWHFTRELNKPGNSEPLPSYICSAFTNPEMTRRLHGESGLAVHVIGRCVEALIVNKLVIDINARNGVVGSTELACLSAILGTKSDDVLLLLRHQGAIELTNIVFLAWANIDCSGSASVPSDILDVVHQTFTTLSQVLPAELNTAMQLDQTDALINVPDGCSSLTAEMYRTDLRLWTKNLWHFTREYNECEGAVPLPSYIHIAFTNPEMNRRIRKQRDPAVRAIGRSVGALVVNKLSADVKSRDVSVSSDELACLSAILGTESGDMRLLLSCPGAIEFTNVVFLSLDNSYSFAFGSVPSYMLDVVRQTAIMLSQALPDELNAKIRLDQTNFMMNISDVATSLTTDRYLSTLRGWMQSIWYFLRWYNERRHSVPLPSYVCVAFTNPELTRRIREQRDLAIREMGRCVGALVVNKLAADLKSLKVLVRDDGIACLSTILGTDSDAVELLLRHPGAVELTNVVFLALDDLDDSPPGTVPTYLLDVIQQTSSALYHDIPSDLKAVIRSTQTDEPEPSVFSHDIPPESKTMVRLTRTDTLMNGADRTLSLKAEIYMAVLHESMRNLWHFTKKRGRLPSSVYVAFTNPEMTRRIHKQRDLTVRAIGCCTGALVAKRLVDDINSRNVPASDVELACLSRILDTQSHDVGLCLSQPGTIQLVNLASLALGVINSFQVNQMPPDAYSLFKETLAIVSQALPAQVATQLLLDEVIALANVSEANFEHTIVSRHHSLLKMCLQGAPSLMEEDRLSCLRTTLRSLWHCGKAYLQTSAPLPSYFPFVLARPEIIGHLLAEHDPVARVIGCCFGALVVDKLVDALELPISCGVGVRNSYLACISAVLGAEHHEAFLLPHRLRVINFWKVVSVISGEVHASSAAAVMPADLLGIVQDTLNVLANRLRDRLFVSGGPPMDQWRSVQDEYSQVVKALSSDQLKNKPVEILDRLRQILEKLLPGVEYSQDAAMQPMRVFDHQSGV